MKLKVGMLIKRIGEDVFEARTQKVKIFKGKFYPIAKIGQSRNEVWVKTEQDDYLWEASYSAIISNRSNYWELASHRHWKL